MPDHQEIEAAENALLAAMRSSNVPALDTLLADELIFTAHTGQLVDKATDLEAHHSGHIRIHSLEASEQVVRVYGELAYVSVLLSISGTFFGQPSSGRFRFSRLWQKKGNSWQIVAGQATKLSI